MVREIREPRENRQRPFAKQDQEYTAEKSGEKARQLSGGERSSQRPIPRGPSSLRCPSLRCTRNPLQTQMTDRNGERAAFTAVARLGTPTFMEGPPAKNFASHPAMP